MQNRSRMFKGVAVLMAVCVFLMAQQPVSQGPQAANAAAWKVDGTGGSFPVTGTVSATQSGTWTTTQSGTWTVQPGNTQNTTPWLAVPTPQSTGTYALTGYDLSATAATQVKGSAGNVYGFFGFNPNASTCYLQFYNSTSATLGVGVLHPFGVVAGGSFVYTSAIPLFNLSSGISTGQTTAATGSSQCSSPMTITILYQ